MRIPIIPGTFYEDCPTMTADIGKDFYFIFVTTDYDQRLLHHLGRIAIYRLKILMAVPKADTWLFEQRLFLNFKKGGRCLKFCRDRSGLIMRHPPALNDFVMFSVDSFILATEGLKACSAPARASLACLPNRFRTLLANWNS